MTLKPDHIRHLITEYLPANSSYGLAVAICREVNPMIETAIVRAECAEKGAYLVRIEALREKAARLEEALTEAATALATMKAAAPEVAPSILALCDRAQEKTKAALEGAG